MTDLSLAYPVYTIFAFIASFLVLIPLPWHLQVWNAGTCMYMLWTALACLNFAINSVVWHGNAINWAPVWCDISSRIIVASSVGIPAASLCINRRLYKIASVTQTTISRDQKRRAVIEDLAIALGIPLVEILLYIVVNGHRFNIYEEIGCYPNVVNVWLSYVLISTWPLAIGVVSGYYCVRTLIAFRRRSIQFKSMVTSNTSLTTSRYFRLIALAMTEVLCTTPFAIYGIWMNVVTEDIAPYPGWANVHFDYGHVDQFPAFLWEADHRAVVSFQATRWLVVACAIIFFGFFGFAEEARKHYRVAFWAVAELFGKKPQPAPQYSISKMSSPSTSGRAESQIGILPVFVPRQERMVHRASDASYLTSDTVVDSDGKITVSPPGALSSPTLASRPPSYEEKQGTAY